VENNLPTFFDISPTKGENLDEKSAVEHFLGKGQREATALFHKNSLHYLDDLMWMGDKAFAFYLPAFLDYLRSADVKQNPDDLNHLIGIIEFRLEHEPHSITIASETILSAIDYCLENYAAFKVNSGIYGDLNAKLLELRGHVAKAREGSVRLSRPK
jgi:hypothetical protein